MRHVAARPASRDVLIAHALAPARVGGLEQVVCALAAEQHARRAPVHVIAVVGDSPGEHPFLAALAASGVPCTALPLPPRGYLRERAELRAILRRIGASVVHTHGYRADVQAGGVARHLGIPTVATAHGFTGGGWRNRVYEALERRAFRRFDAVVAVSRPLAARLVASGVPADRVRLIPNAAPPAVPLRSRAEARRLLGIPEEGYALGWVGRLSREKGPDVLVRALGLLRELPLRAVFLGTGPEQAALVRLAERFGVGDRVHWCGLVPGAGRLFRAFDCFVLSSRTEGTPIVLFEAMAAQTPIVATAVGGVPDVVSEREALLVPVEPARLAEALAAVAADPAAAQARAAAARARLDAERSRGPWVSAYDAVYHAAIARNRPGGASC